MKDTSYGKGRVESFLGIAILAVTLTLKGVLWIVPIARIRQIFSQEYAVVVNSSKARNKMTADLLAFVAGSDHSLVASRNGYICANLLVYTGGEEKQAWVPLPLHQSEVAWGKTNHPMSPRLVSIVRSLVLLRKCRSWIIR